MKQGIYGLENIYDTYNVQNNQFLYVVTSKKRMSIVNLFRRLFAVEICILVLNKLYFKFH